MAGAQGQEQAVKSNSDYDLDNPITSKVGLRQGLASYGDPHFSLFLRKVFIKALGYSEDALSRPIIGIVNTYSSFNPCHANIPQLIDAVKRGVQLNGGLAIDFPTISTALPYAFGQVMIELPYIFVQSVIYGVIVYSMIGFDWNAKKFLWYIFFMYFTLLYFTFYGMMAVAVTPNHNIAAIISSAFYAIWNLFSGFIIPQTRIPVWWRWYYWICPIAWTIYGLFASQFGDIQDKLDTGDTVEQFLRSYFGFKHDFLGVVAVVIVGFTVLFAFIFAFSIRQFNFQKR